jgi:RHS repeat-associated protein
VSNENAPLVDVYFDDVKITHTPSNLIQSNEYYPFGLQTANSWTRENVTGNNFLANGGTELNTTTSLYDLDFRNYDPILGRMNQVDPMASRYGSLTPYQFANNNPVYYVDPSGATTIADIAGEIAAAAVPATLPMANDGGGGGWTTRMSRCPRSLYNRPPRY